VRQTDAAENMTMPRSPEVKINTQYMETNATSYVLLEEIKLPSTAIFISVRAGKT